MDKQKSLKLLLIDFDRTIATLDVDYDKLREELREYFGVLEGPDFAFKPIMDTINKLSHGSSQKRQDAFDLIDKHEVTAAKKTSFIPGALRLLCKARQMNIPIAIITRNGSKCIEAFWNSQSSETPSYDFLVARDDTPKLKPAIEHANIILDKLRLLSGDSILVGDSYHDVELGKAAGIKTFLVQNEKDYNIVIEYIEKEQQ